MDIFDFKPIECPICKTPMRCMHISISNTMFDEDNRYIIMYRCKKRHIFQGTFEEKEFAALKEGTYGLDTGK